MNRLSTGNTEFHYIQRNFLPGNGCGDAGGGRDMGAAREKYKKTQTIYFWHVTRQSGRR